MGWDVIDRERERKKEFLKKNIYFIILLFYSCLKNLGLKNKEEGERDRNLMKKESEIKKCMI